SGITRTITALEDKSRVLTAADFGFSDVDGNGFAAVKVTTLPAKRGLILDGAAVSAGQLISIADINAGKLAFKGAPNGNGVGYAGFTFQLKDNGGAANGVVDLAQSPDKLTITLHDALPISSGTTRTITAVEDKSRVLTAADFGFSDVDGNGFAA